MFIAGTYFFGLLTFAILVNIESKQGLLFGTNRPWAFPVVCLAAGIVGGLLLVLLWRLGLAAIGGLLGFVVSVLILSVVSGGLLSSEIARYVFTGVLVLIGAILILFIERPILILGTAFPGSYAIFFGLDTFINTGFNQALQSFFGTGVLYVATPAVYGMMAGTVLLALLGCGIQYRGSANSKSYRERAGYNNVPSGYVQPKV